MGFWDRVRSVFGREPARAVETRTGSPGPIIRPLPLSLQIQRIGGNITPAQVSDILREADVGYMWRLVDLANESRQKDCHLQSVLYTRESAVASLDWAVLPARKPGREKPLSKDVRIARFIDDALRQTTAPAGLAGDLVGFTDAIAHLNGAVYYGHGVCETMLTRTPADFIVPVGFSKISPRRFRYSLSTSRLEWWDASGGDAGNGVDLMRTYPGRFIQHQPRINGDVPCREGLVRVLMWAALFRNWDIRDWMSLAELAWKPWRTGAYQKGASQEDIENLETILDAMSSSGVAVYPHTTEVKVEWPKNPPSSGSTHGELAAFMGAEMSKAALGQTLTTEAGSRGARALGEVHDVVRKDIREADAVALAATLRRDLIAPLVRMNFGPTAAIPDFRFLTDDAVDLVSFGQGVKSLTEAGTRIPQAWVRDRAGIPEPREDEECLGDAVDVDLSDLDQDAANADQPAKEAA